MKNFTRLQAKLLQHIQQAVPLVQCPFQMIAEQLGISEKDCLSELTQLTEREVIRDISAIFNPVALGFNTTLVAFSVKDEFLERAATVINAYPGVSHNYIRDDRLNIWFTLAVEPGIDIDTLIEFLSDQAHADYYMVFPKIKQLKLGMVLDIAGNNSNRAQQAIVSQEIEHPFKELSRHDKKVISLLQQNLPLTEKPFQELVIDNHDLISEEHLLTTAQHYLEQGVIRRYAAVLRHTKSGYIANAMTVWKFSLDDIDTLKPFIQNSAITHLYIRSAYPREWEYPLFAMIHAKSDKELNKTIKKLSRQSGLKEYRILQSVKELKKQRIRYFSKQFDEWHNR